jgi:hypothetical protein
MYNRAFWQNEAKKLNDFNANPPVLGQVWPEIARSSDHD